MINDQPKEAQLSYIIGRIQGLSGTIRYNLDDDCRKELKEIAMHLEVVSQM